jgi:hypothetical protein
VTELPRVLPVEKLSYSSIKTYLQCPERWRRRYIEGQYEPSNVNQIRGTAVHSAEGTNFRQKIFSKEDLPQSDVLDAYATSFDAELAMQELQPTSSKDIGKAKDVGARLLRVYHMTLAPQVRPAQVERMLSLHYEGAAWSFVGKLDVETVDGHVIDIKTKDKAMPQAEVDQDLQPTAYAALQAAHGDEPWGVEYHVLKDTTVVEAQIQVARRSWADVEAFHDRIALIAREIVVRAENDLWQGALPGSWWCSQKWCGHWRDCRWGGGR